MLVGDLSPRIGRGEEMVNCSAGRSAIRLGADEIRSGASKDLISPLSTLVAVMYATLGVLALLGEQTQLVYCEAARSAIRSEVDEIRSDAVRDLISSDPTTIAEVDAAPGAISVTATMVSRKQSMRGDLAFSTTLQ